METINAPASRVNAADLVRLDYVASLFCPLLSCSRKTLHGRLRAGRLGIQPVARAGAHTPLYLRRDVDKAYNDILAQVTNDNTGV